MTLGQGRTLVAGRKHGPESGNGYRVTELDSFETDKYGNTCFNKRYTVSQIIVSSDQNCGMRKNDSLSFSTNYFRVFIETSRVFIPFQRSINHENPMKIL